MKNIVLIGMPGCGKSTLGVLLAKVLGYPFVDTDLIIQQNSGRLLQDIIDKEGIKVFLELEERSVAGLDIKKSVVATGGSVVYSKAAMENLKKDGLIVYLKLEYKDVESRIKNIKSRGIAMEKGQTLLSLYRERTPLYEKYQDITIDCSGKGMEETLAIISKEIAGQLT